VTILDELSLRTMNNVKITSKVTGNSSNSPRPSIIKAAVGTHFVSSVSL